MKKDFTEEERKSITALCSLYDMQTAFDEEGIFVGYIPENRRMALNDKYFMRIISSTNTVYIEERQGWLVLTIVAI